MKNSKLIEIFDLSSKILSHYRNKNVVFALKDLLKLLENKSKLPADKTKKEKNSDKNDVVTVSAYSANELSKLNLDEVRSILSNTQHFPSIDALKNIAQDLGLKTQSRVNRTNIEHLILKTIERSRIDRTIRSRRENK